MLNPEGNFLKSVMSVITGLIFTHISLIIFSGGRFKPIDWLDSIQKAPLFSVAVIVSMIMSFMCFYLANLIRNKDKVK